MIPKKINYCWFGGGPLSDMAKKCIASWEKYCPDYEIIRWDESNYNINKCSYMRQAYEEKKWGFVPDYARIDIVNQYGGIYMDTDVELVKPLDDILECSMYCGFENDTKVNFGLGFGAEPGHPLLCLILEYYKTLSFYEKDGTLNLTPSPVYQTRSLLEWGLVPDNTYQKLNDGVIVFPREYLCPRELDSEQIKITDKTISIHHFEGSWLPEESRYAAKLRIKYKKFDCLHIMPYVAQFIATVKYQGFLSAVKKIKKKICKRRAR